MKPLRDRNVQIPPGNLSYSSHALFYTFQVSDNKTPTKVGQLVALFFDSQNYRSSQVRLARSNHFFCLRYPSATFQLVQGDKACGVALKSAISSYK